MEIESFRALCEVAETGSFNEAARRTGVSGQRVAYEIKALERELGLVIFQRRQEHNQLTPDGQVVYETGKRIVRDYEALRAALREMKGEPPPLPVTPPARLDAVPLAHLAATVSPRLPTNPPASPPNYSI